MISLSVATQITNAVARKRDKVPCSFEGRLKDQIRVAWYNKYQLGEVSLVLISRQLNPQRAQSSPSVGSVSFLPEVLGSNPSPDVQLNLLSFCFAFLPFSFPYPNLIGKASSYPSISTDVDN